MSRGRKRKPIKTGRRASRPGGSARSAPPAEHGFDARAYLDDLSPLATKADVERTMDRRVFTMPFYGTTIRGEDFDRLNPADPDERGLLIEGEHPEYHEALADPLWDGDVDGVNPRLHFVIHEIVANQLWADDPPEAWQAAQRLRDQGMVRHDILHELMGAAVKHLHPALAESEPYDADGYRRSLNDLGRRDTARPRPGDTY